MAGFWKNVLTSAIESTETGQAIAELKKAKIDYDAAKNPPPPAPPTALTPLQKTAVAGAAANRLQRTGTAPAPTPVPTPIARPILKVNTPTGVRPTIKVNPPRVLTPLQQQAAAAVSQQNPKRPNLVMQPSTPAAAPVAKSRTQKRPSKRGLGPQAKAAFASLHEHFGNQ